MPWAFCAGPGLPASSPAPPPLPGTSAPHKGRPWRTSCRGGGQTPSPTVAFLKLRPKSKLHLPSTDARDSFFQQLLRKRRNRRSFRVTSPGMDPQTFKKAELEAEALCFEGRKVIRIVLMFQRVIFRIICVCALCCQRLSFLGLVGPAKLLGCSLGYPRLLLDYLHRLQWFLGFLQGYFTP